MIKAGERLKEERIKKGLTIEDVSQGTKIRPNFLEYIEKSEYGKLPSATFAHGFVRNYSSFLGLPEDEVLGLFKREFDEEKVFRVLPEGMGRDVDRPIGRTNFSQVFLIGILFVALLGFILFQYKDAIISPSVSVTSPLENQTFHATTVVVSGKTNPENVVYVNNLPVSVKDDGTFEKVISVFSGKASIDIKVVNRFNKVTEIKRDINVTTQ